MPAQEAKPAVYDTNTIEMSYENPPVAYGTTPNGRTVTYDNEADTAHYECGVELPLGEITYKIDFEEDGIAYIDVFDENGDFVEGSDSGAVSMWGGELNDIQEDTFICKEGYSVSVSYDSAGNISFTTSELIEEAIPGVAAIPAEPAIPAKEITETLSYDSRSGTWTATSNGVTVEPNELREYDKLKADIEKQMN